MVAPTEVFTALAYSVRTKMYDALTLGAMERGLRLRDCASMAVAEPGIPAAIVRRLHSPMPPTPPDT
jgi:hypothetical protein